MVKNIAPHGKLVNRIVSMEDREILQDKTAHYDMKNPANSRDVRSRHDSGWGHEPS